MTFTHALSTNNYGEAKFIVSDVPSNGTHTTIASAIAAASAGDTIFVRAKTNGASYVENLTLKENTSIVSYDPLTSIQGKLTLTGAGTYFITGLLLISNGDNIVEVTGSNIVVAWFTDCKFYVDGADGFDINNSNASTQIYVVGGRGDSTNSAGEDFCLVQDGRLNFESFYHDGPFVASCVVNGTGDLVVENSRFAAQFHTADTGSLRMIGTQQGLGNTCVFINSNPSQSGTRPNLIHHCRLGAGVGAAIDIGASGGVLVTNTNLSSSNTYAVTGTGELYHAGNAYGLGSCAIEPTITQIIRPIGDKVLVGSSNSGQTNTHAVENNSNTASSAARQLLSVGGGTAGDSYTQYTVTGATDWTTGIDNSDSDAWVVSNATTLGSSNAIKADTSENVFLATPMSGTNFTNLGMTYSAGTFTICSFNGTALSATNPAHVYLPSKASPGIHTKYTITANQNFVDDAGSSEIVGNLFGFTTAVAITVDVPFYIYAVSNDAENDIQFMLSRYPHKTISSATIGDPGSAVADAEGNFWAFNDITVGDYDQNPCICVGSIRMRMSASDDWTVQALSNTGDGIGNYNEDTSFTQPLGQFGANSGTMTIPNGGTAAVFTTTTTSYYVSKDGYCHYKFVLDGDGGTDGATAVSALFTMPFTNPTMASYGVGKGRWAGASASQPLSLELVTSVPNAFQTINISPGTTQWNAFTSGSRNISGTIYMKLA